MSPQPSLTRAKRQTPRRSLPKLPDHTKMGAAPGRRLFLLGAAAVLLQIVFFDRLALFGMRLNLSILTVVLVATLAGSIEGSIMGFGVGLTIDLLYGQTLGVSAMALTATGYGVGQVALVRDPDSNVAVVLIAMLGTLAALLIQAFLALMLNSSQSIGFGLAWQWLGTIILAALLSIPLLLRVRAWLLPMLPEEVRKRRRRRTPGERAVRSPDLRPR